MSTVTLTMAQVHTIYCKIKKYKRLVDINEREHIIRYCILSSPRDDIKATVGIQSIYTSEHGEAKTSFESDGALQILRFMETSDLFSIHPVLNLDFKSYSKIPMFLKRMEQLDEMLRIVLDGEIDFSDQNEESFLFKDHGKNRLLTDRREFETWFREQM